MSISNVLSIAAVVVPIVAPQFAMVTAPLLGAAAAATKQKSEPTPEEQKLSFLLSTAQLLSASGDSKKAQELLEQAALLKKQLGSPDQQGVSVSNVASLAGTVLPIVAPQFAAAAPVLSAVGAATRGAA